MMIIMMMAVVLLLMMMMLILVTTVYDPQITSIQRTPTNQSEKVDVKYRVLDDNKIVPASEVADKTNQLSDNELMFALKMPVGDGIDPIHCVTMFSHFRPRVIP